MTRLLRPDCVCQSILGVDGAFGPTPIGLRLRLPPPRFTDQSPGLRKRSGHLAAGASQIQPENVNTRGF